MQFQHHPDNIIYVTAQDKKYIDTLENFLNDYPSYSGLPATYVERIYCPEKRLSFIGTGMSQVIQELPWAEGETIFSQIDNLLAKQLIRKTPVSTLAEAKAKKLYQISFWTKNKIIGGFVSTASGANVTYDSDEDTQSTMQTMYTATKSPDFANHPEYQGVIPVRGYADGATAKTVFYLTATQVQKFMDDLALHIGKCKQVGWEKQALVEAALSKEDLAAIILD